MFFDLPEDIVKLIYEFSADHREKFEKTLKRIPIVLSFDSLHHYCRGHYVAIHSSNFRDFVLKPELLRAINDCGFEHPSEG